MKLRRPIIGFRRRVSTPVLQLLAAAGVILGGAWLISLWMVGIVLMLAGLGLGVDALLRDSGGSSLQRPHTHEDVLERYRRAK
jgi:hypothetical protein